MRKQDLKKYVNVKLKRELHTEISILSHQSNKLISDVIAEIVKDYFLRYPNIKRPAALLQAHNTKE